MSLPALRFPEFEGEWSTHLVGSILERKCDAVAVDPNESYRQIGVRSHGRGVFGLVITYSLPSSVKMCECDHLLKGPWNCMSLNISPGEFSI